MVVSFWTTDLTPESEEPFKAKLIGSKMKIEQMKQGNQ